MIGQVCNRIKHYKSEKIFKVLTKQILYVCVHIHELYIHMCIYMGFHNGFMDKETVQYRRHSFNLWVRKSPGIGYGNSLQYSRWENPMDRGAWWARVHGVAKNHTWLSNWTEMNRKEDIKKRWKEYTEELYKKDLNDLDNHDGVILT